MRKKITYKTEFNDKPILTNRDKKQGCYVDILTKTEQVFNKAVDNHSKVFFMRLDFRFNTSNDYPSDNKLFSGFLNSYIKNLERNKLDPHYIWCREQSREKHQHYHLALLLNGNKTKSIYNHFHKAEELWTKKLGLTPVINNGLVNNCTLDRNGKKQENGVLINRNSEDFIKQYNGCFKRSSYLAKENTKSNTPKKKKSYGSSKL